MAAFHIVAYFLFNHLDPSRTAETFRCKEIQGVIPQVTPSLFVSPGGPKLIQLLYVLARYVIVKAMQAKSRGTGIPFEALKLTPKNIYMANARCRVAYNKLLQVFQRQDFILREYEKKAQLLINEIKQMKSKYSFLQMQTGRMKEIGQNKENKTKRIQKVRSMWTLTIEALTPLKKEVVDSVLESCADQSILDGAAVDLHVSQPLVHRVVNDIHQLCIGNTYEDGKLNFLTVIQLLNESLRTLREERQSEVKQQFQVIENRVTVSNKVRQDVKAARLKREQQHRMLSNSISREQEDWEGKWKSFLGQCPLNLILSQEKELGLRVLPPGSVNLAEDNEDGVFRQHLTLDFRDSINEVSCEEPDWALRTVMSTHHRDGGQHYQSISPSGWCSKEWNTKQRFSPVPLESCLVLDASDTFMEEGKEKAVPSEILKNGKDKPTVSETCENSGDDVTQTESPLKEDELPKKAQDELAEEVAKAVMYELPQSGEGKGMAEHTMLLPCTLFLTRKQIPRTPETLLTEIRSSWRRALQTEGSSDAELPSTEVVAEEALTNGGPVMQKVSDSRFCTPASPVPDSDPLLSDVNSQLNITELRPWKQMTRSHIIEPPILETLGMRESKRAEEQENSISHEAAYLRIMDETLPEEPNNVDPNESGSSEFYFDIIDMSHVTGGLKNKGDIQKLKLDSQCILNTPEVLKKTTSGNEEELHQTHSGAEYVNCTSDLSFSPQNREMDRLCSPVKQFCLDEEFAKTPTPVSLNEKKKSLSSLLVSCQHLDEMASAVHEISLDLIHKLQDEEQLNEKEGTEEPSSG
ncbi:HAUS augmin-like complex subunit 6 [Rhynochetos jubatus]